MSKNKLKYCTCKWRLGEGIPVQGLKYPFTNIKCPKCHKILRYTATEITAYDELQQRNNLICTTLQELAVVLRKTGDLLDILTRPTIGYYKGYKFTI